MGRFRMTTLSPAMHVRVLPSWRDLKFWAPTDVMNGRVAEGVGLHHFGLTGGLHPYVRAVEAALTCRDEEDAERAVREALSAYYWRVQPRTPAEWLGLDDAPAALVDAPPYAVTLPWQKNSPARWQEVREAGIPNENRLAGDHIPISDGWHACGPVSERKLDVEVRRLLKLLRSIQRKGLVRHSGRDGDIDAVLLKNPRGQRWWINSGHHRSAVLVALGCDTVPVRIKATVDTADVHEWAQVRSGLFTPEQAVKVVDRIIDGDLPPVTSAWVQYVDSQRPMRRTA